MTTMNLDTNINKNDLGKLIIQMLRKAKLQDKTIFDFSLNETFSGFKISTLSSNGRKIIDLVVQEYREVNKDNFYISTYASFTKLNDTPNRKADFVSSSGSKYWYTDEGVIRQSDHWTEDIRSCSWLLEDEEIASDFINPDFTAIGFCAWNDFQSNSSYITHSNKKISLNEVLEKLTSIL